MLEGDKARIKMMVNKLCIEADNDRIKSEWDVEFIYSLRSRVRMGIGLSSRQIAKLEELFERY